MGSFAFSLGSIPVRIHGVFVLTALLLGAGKGTSPLSIAIWAAIVLISVMVHELGHAGVGIAFGLRPQIDLHGMGGTTSWLIDPSDANVTRERLSAWRSMFVSFAGPLAGLILGVIVVLCERGVPNPSPLVKQAFEDAKWVNIGWSIFNLLPMLPLDGGNILASFVRGITGGRGQIAVRYWSIGIAVLLGALGLKLQALVLVALAAVFVMQNMRGLSLVKRLAAEEPLKDLVAQGKQAVDNRDGRSAIVMGETVVREAVTLEMRREGLMLLAYGRLLEGQWAHLMQLLEAGRVEFGASELARFEATVRELGRTEDADQIRGWVNAAAGFKS